LREILAATYTEHRQGLFSLALSVTGDRQLAEDAVQSAFEKLIRLSASPNGNPVAYVFSAVRNAAHDCVHRNGSPRQSLFVDCEAVTPEASAEADERLAAVQAAVMNLEDEEREVVILKAFSELTYDCIGLVLQVPAKTCATRYRRALLKLEEKLRGQI